MTDVETCPDCGAMLTKHTNKALVNCALSKLKKIGKKID